MRARNIKPGFFKNEQLAECSPFARLLFPGLWMLADRAGRLEYRPKRWKGEIFAYDNVDTTILFEELETNGLARRYVVNGTWYVWLPHFLDHQKPHPNERPSVLPAHPDDVDATQGTPSVEQIDQLDDELTIKVIHTSNQGDTHFKPWSNSIGLNPSSSSLREEKDKEGGNIAPAHIALNVPENEPQKTDCPSKSSPQWPAFLSCWQIYPVQQGQEAAWREWMRLHGNGTLATAWEIRDTILLLRQQDTRWLRGKVPKMARWLAEKGWDDKPYIEPADHVPKNFALPRANSVAQTQVLNRQLMAKMLLEDKNAKQTGNTQDFDEIVDALPPGRSLAGAARCAG